MKMLRENLIGVLHIAIADQEKYEKEVLKYRGNSCFVQGLKTVLESARNGEHIEIVEK